MLAHCFPLLWNFFYQYYFGKLFLGMYKNKIFKILDINLKCYVFQIRIPKNSKNVSFMSLNIMTKLKLNFYENMQFIIRIALGLYHQTTILVLTT